MLIFAKHLFFFLKFVFLIFRCFWRLFFLKKLWILLIIRKSYHLFWEFLKFQFDSYIIEKFILDKDTSKHLFFKFGADWAFILKNFLFCHNFIYRLGCFFLDFILILRLILYRRYFKSNIMINFVSLCDLSSLLNHIFSLK